MDPSVVLLGLLPCIPGGTSSGGSWGSYLVSQVNPPVVVLEALFVGCGEAAEFTTEDLALLSLVDHPDVDLDGTGCSERLTAVVALVRL